MKNIFALILLCFNLALFSQEEGERYPNFPVTNLQQIGGGSGFWIVSGNVNDPAGKYDATDIDSSDVLFLADGGNSFILPIDSVLLAASSSFQVRVLNTGITGTLSAIPTGNPAYISQTTTNYGLVPWIANLNATENQLSLENTFYLIDSLLNISGGSNDGVITGLTFSGSSGDPTRSFTVTRSVGADITGSINVMDADANSTNEGSLTVTAGTSTTSIINSNTTGSSPVTITAGPGLEISETGNNITLTNSSPGDDVSTFTDGTTITPSEKLVSPDSLYTFAQLVTFLKDSIGVASVAYNGSTLTITRKDGSTVATALANVVSGAGAPVGAPGTGQRWYIDTMNDVMYYADSGAWLLFDADNVPLTDAGGYFTTDNVEAALQELGAVNRLPTLDDAYNNYGSSATVITADKGKPLEFNMANATDDFYIDLNNGAAFEVRRFGATNKFTFKSENGDTKIKMPFSGDFFQILDPNDASVIHINSSNANIISFNNTVSSGADSLFCLGLADANGLFSQGNNASKWNYKFDQKGNTAAFNAATFHDFGNLNDAGPEYGFFSIMANLTGSSGTRRYTVLDSKYFTVNSSGSRNDTIGVIHWRPTITSTGSSFTNIPLHIESGKSIFKVGTEVHVRGSLFDRNTSSGTAGQVPVADGTGNWDWGSLRYDTQKNSAANGVTTTLVDDGKSLTMWVVVDSVVGTSTVIRIPNPTADLSKVEVIITFQGFATGATATITTPGGTNVITDRINFPAAPYRASIVVDETKVGAEYHFRLNTNNTIWLQGS